MSLIPAESRNFPDLLGQEHGYGQPQRKRSKKKPAEPEIEPQPVPAATTEGSKQVATPATSAVAPEEQNSSPTREKSGARNGSVADHPDAMPVSKSPFLSPEPQNFIRILEEYIETNGIPAPFPVPIPPTMEVRAQAPIEPMLELAVGAPVQPVVELPPPLAAQPVVEAPPPLPPELPVDPVPAQIENLSEGPPLTPDAPRKKRLQKKFRGKVSLPKLFAPAEGDQKPATPLIRTPLPPLPQRSVSQMRAKIESQTAADLPRPVTRLRTPARVLPTLQPPTVVERDQLQRIEGSNEPEAVEQPKQFEWTEQPPQPQWTEQPAQWTEPLPPSDWNEAPQPSQWNLPPAQPQWVEEPKPMTSQEQLLQQLGQLHRTQQKVEPIGTESQEDVEWTQPRDFPSAMERFRSTKLIRFIVAEAIAIVLLLGSVSLGSSHHSAGADPMGLVLNILTIASAASAVIIPIVFYGVPETFPQDDR
jgi:hypothetical protein